MATAFLPMSYALPGSPITGPNPPARANSNGAVLPRTAEPVPAITTTLGISPVAPRESTRSLVIRIIAFGNPGCSPNCRAERMLGSPAPEMPATRYATSFSDLPAVRSASDAAPESAASETSAPKLVGLDAPERERAATAPDSSMRTQSVLVPPPSKPRTQRMPQEYARTSSLYQGRLRRCILARTLPPVPHRSAALGQAT